MAYSLSAFNTPTDTEAQNTDLRSFQPERQPSPSATPDTINLIAGYGAALSPDGNVDGAYISISNELMNGSSSFTLNQIINDWDQRNMEGYYEGLRSILLDPTLTDEDKKSIIEGFSDHQFNNSLFKRVAQSAIISPSEGETGESMYIRELLIDTLDESDAYTAWAQQQINAINSELSTGWTSGVNSFVNMLIPFSEGADQAYLEQVLSTMVDEDIGGLGNGVQALLLLGEGRERLRNIIQSAPLDKRREITSALLDIVRSTRGSIIVGDGNDPLRGMIILESMLNPAAYGDTERWMDNIFSVLDDTILLAPFARGAKGVSRAIGGLVSRGGNAEQAASTLRRGTLAETEIAARSAEGPVADVPLQIEWKPAVGRSYANDVDDVIDSLPIEAPSAEITELRRTINESIYSPNGMNIDEIIESSPIFDRMSVEQINQTRGQLGTIQQTRRIELEGMTPVTPARPADIVPSTVKGTASPTSIQRIYGNTNPSLYRNAVRTIEANEGDRAASIIAGTTRQNALADAYLPEISVGTGRVKAKPEMPENFMGDSSILHKYYEAKSDIQYKDAEKFEARQKVIGDFRNAQGLVTRAAMSTFEDIDSGVKLSIKYGPSDSGYKNAYNGIDVVKQALAKYGVREDDLTVLSRQANGEYGPPVAGTNFNNGDFLIQVDYDYRFQAKDINYQPFDNAPLLSKFDISPPREVGGEGGIVQHVIPKGSVIDSGVFAAGTSYTDKAAGMQRNLFQYQKNMDRAWKKLNKPQRDIVNQYIRRANDEEWVFEIAKLRGAGMNDDAVEFMTNWKTAQDTLYLMENVDLNVTLRGQNYQYFVDRNNTKLLGKPVGRSVFDSNNTTKFYVPDEGGIARQLSRQEVDELYDKGGTLVELRSHVEMDGDVITHLVSKNTPDGGYLRAIRDDDVTLNYRHGYYHRRYTDPYYITVTNKTTGKTTTIARSGNLADAKAEVNRLTDAASDSNLEYNWKHDRNKSLQDNFDDEFDVAVSSGRTSQRMRGEKLRRVGTDKSISDVSMESPLESLQRSVASLSTRIHTRELIESNKRRFLKEFGHLLPGGKRTGKFPTEVNQIDGTKAKRFGEAANARNTWRYINGLEAGYSNMIDDFSKGFFNKLADTTSGARGFGWINKLAKSGAEVSPSRLARATAFGLGLAGNPLRQLVLQTAPLLSILPSTNPLGIPRVMQQLSFLRATNFGVDGVVARKIGKWQGVNAEDARLLLRDYERSGIHAAVDAHSYRQNTMFELADKNIGAKIINMAGKPLEFSRKIGFDTAEQTAMEAVWLSERDRMIRRVGRKDLSPAELDTVTARARAMLGDMNKGGDLPYNANSLSVMFQFMQNVHKLTANMIFGHRGFSRGDRWKMLAGGMLVFGFPVGALIDKVVDELDVNNTELRETLKGGLLNLALNSFLSSVSGEDVRVDFSDSLNPYTLDPMIDLIGGMLSGNLQEVITSAPGVSLISEGGRISEFAKSLARPFVPNDYQSIDEFQQIGLSFLQMFSGISNAMKAMYILEHGKIVTNSGQVVDNEVNYIEAMWKAAGFQTVDEVYYWAGSQARWEASSGMQEDIEKVVDEIFRQLTRQGADISTINSQLEVAAEAGRIFNNNPAIMQRVGEYVTFKLRQNPEYLAQWVYQNIGLIPEDQLRRVMNEGGLSGEERAKIEELINITRGSYGN